VKFGTVIFTISLFELYKVKHGRVGGRL